MLVLLSACGSNTEPAPEAEAHSAPEEVVKGPHNGRLLTDGRRFAVELPIFETGVPPEYHAWPTLDGRPIALDQVDLAVELTRLGDKIDRFTFAPQQDYLRGNGVVHEPHSFIVKVNAAHAGKRHEWSFESFEGRTKDRSADRRGAGSAPRSPVPRSWSTPSRCTAASCRIPHTIVRSAPVSRG